MAVDFGAVEHREGDRMSDCMTTTATVETTDHGHEIRTRTDYLQMIAVLAARRSDPAPLTLLAVRDLLSARGLTCTHAEVCTLINTVLAGEIVAARAEQVREMMRGRDARD